MEKVRVGRGGGVGGWVGVGAGDCFAWSDA